MKRILDSVHGYIEIDNTYVENIVDTEYFQRLRRVEQTSTRTLFPSARHDRFIHSLGVFHLGCKIVSHLREDLQGEQIENLDGIFESYILACLLHDVAHSPFSHTLEEFYENQWSDLRGVLKQVVANPEFSEDWDNVSDPSAQHERMSAIVAVGKFGDFIRNREADPVLVARMIIGLGFRDRVNHSFENAMIELIHGDVIDADGLDYVCRDAWASGYSTTSVDVERLISSIKIVRDQNNENYYRLCFTSKSLNEIESVLKVKTFQQYYVIHHHTVTYEQRLLVKALESAACFHVFGERNVGDSNRRKEALQRLCQVKCFYSQDGNNWVETDHTHIRIQLPMDDDFVSLMKPVRDDKYVSQWLSRRFLLKPLWKSKAEFYKRFGNLRDVKLTENSWIFHNDCREFINQRTGIPLEDIWIEKATPKYKGKFADKVWIYVNGEPTQYSKLFLKDISSFEPLQNEFFFIYIPRDADIQRVLDDLENEYSKYFAIRA